jgi:SAM-dependent methyltransferase
MHIAYYWQLLTSLPYSVPRRILGKTARKYPLIEPFVRDKDGLEIGGPSPIFGRRKLIPVYDRCRKIDNCDFASRTIWNGSLGISEAAASFGVQFVAEGTNLASLKDRKYDFILASHVLEHVANPLLALEQWSHLLRPEGMMLVIVPDKQGTFDHRRPYTTFEHIEADFQKETPESDLTHLDEIFALHDLALDPRAGSPSQFRDRCLNNFTVRAMHHHVFSPQVMLQMFSRIGMKALNISIERPYHIVAMARQSNEVRHEDSQFHKYSNAQTSFAS